MRAQVEPIIIRDGPSSKTNHKIQIKYLQYEIHPLTQRFKLTSMRADHEEVRRKRMEREVWQLREKISDMHLKIATTTKGVPVAKVLVEKISDHKKRWRKLCRDVIMSKEAIKSSIPPATFVPKTNTIDRRASLPAISRRNSVAVPPPGAGHKLSLPVGLNKTATPSAPAAAESREKEAPPALNQNKALPAPASMRRTSLPMTRKQITRLSPTERTVLSSTIGGTSPLPSIPDHEPSGLASPETSMPAIISNPSS